MARTLPTLVLAGIAVVGGTYALAGSGASENAKSSDPVLLTATVNSDGSLVKSRSSGAVSVLHPSVGKYRITFNRSLSRCAISTASLAGNTTTSFGWNNRIMATTSGSNLYLTLQGENDGPADFASSVVLACSASATGVGTVTPVLPGPGSGSGTTTTAMPMMYATVSATGALQRTRSLGATAVVHTYPGKYRITFSRSVARCALSVASLAGNTTSSFGWDNRIMLTTSGQYVYATLQGKNDGPSDYAFSVILACTSLPQPPTGVSPPDWTTPAQ